MRAFLGKAMAFISIPIISQLLIFGTDSKASARNACYRNGSIISWFPRLMVSKHLRAKESQLFIVCNQHQISIQAVTFS
jgi:hypothetical protein